MNIALPALIVFFLLLPGFVARTRIKRVERLSIDYSPFGQVVTEAVVWAFALHLIWVGLMPWIAGYTWRPEVVIRLFSTEAALQSRALDTVAGQAHLIAAYFGSLLAFAYVSPFVLRWLVEHYRWDRFGAPYSRLFRFSGAPWYYLLSGADFPRENMPDLIVISAVVGVAGEPYLYMGVLEDYFLNPDGELDRLVLSQVMRRPMARDRAPDAKDRDLSRFYVVEGDYFVLRYSEITTLNVEYIRLGPVEAQGSQPAQDEPALR